MSGPDAVEILRRMAQNNAWANLRLHRAVATLTDEAYRATRTSFFPSIHLTLVHILFVDRYYVGALAGSIDAAANWAEMARWEREAVFPDVQAAQREVDQRLIHLLDGEPDVQARVELPRRDRIQRERRCDVLLHLFQHQIHHRGQAHAMLSGTDVAPPQLDEFFLADELPLRRAELEVLGLPPR